MKIATFNVNGVNGRLPRLLEWLEEAKPDVACPQEIKTGDATFPAAAIESAGYRAVWHGQRSHRGVAILARGDAPREVRRGLPGDASDVQARYLEADVFGLEVASVYLPNGTSVGIAHRLKIEIFDAIERIQKSGTAILMAEQNAQSALRIADRVYVLEHGRIGRDGTSAELGADDYTRGRSFARRWPRPGPTSRCRGWTHSGSLRAG